MGVGEDVGVTSAGGVGVWLGVDGEDAAKVGVDGGETVGAVGLGGAVADGVPVFLSVLAKK